MACLFQNAEKMPFNYARCENVFHHRMPAVDTNVNMHLTVCKANFSYEKCFPHTRADRAVKSYMWGFLTADRQSGRETHRSLTIDSNKHRLTRDSD